MKDLIFDGDYKKILNDKLLCKRVNIQEELNKYFINIPKCIYPKYNVIYINNQNIRIDIALAGFEKKHLKVMFLEGELTILGNIMQDIAEINENMDDDNYLIKFISNRNFVIYFYVKPSVDISNVTFTNGLLQVNLHIKYNNNTNYIPIQ